ncbi:MAG TPA: acetoacetate decarboxylase family protein [Spirochaetota bacterium]|nr:acetoacetate decarboxylase family protein [Spirochaetota bacterium]HPJ35861.1 acetoacetate decarboxylase family protein [Spirochaetota bacterium]
MGFTRTLQEIAASKRDSFNFYGTEVITLVWETKEDIVARLLPEPLKPAKRPLAMAYIANNPSTDFGEPCLESALFLIAEYNGEEGGFCLSMSVNDDMALIRGREYFGYPKKIGNISLSKNDTTAGGWTERHGIRFMEIKAKMTGKLNDPDSLDTILGLYKQREGAQALTAYNFKYFPSSDLTGFDFIPRLMKEEVLFRPEKFEPCEGEIIFNSSEDDPWHEVEVVKVLGAFYTVGNNTMLKGSYVAEADPMKFIPFAYMKMDAKKTA